MSRRVELIQNKYNVVSYRQLKIGVRQKKGGVNNSAPRGQEQELKIKSQGGQGREASIKQLMGGRLRQGERAACAKTKCRKW